MLHVSLGGYPYPPSSDGEPLHRCSANGGDKDFPPSSTPDNQEEGGRVHPPEHNRNGATPPSSDGEPLQCCSANGGGIHPSPPPETSSNDPLKGAEVFE